MKKNTMTVAEYLRRYAARGALIATLSASTFFMNSCMEKTVEREAFDNVHTIVQETSPGKFEIIDEIYVNDSSWVTIKYVNGNKKEMTIEEAQKLVSSSTVEEDYNGGNYSDNYYNSSLESALFWGVIGYHVGRPIHYPLYSGYYTSPGVFTRVQTVNSRVVQSRRTVSVPASYKGSVKSGTSTTSRPTATRSSSPSSSKSGYGSSSSRSSGSS